MVTTLAVITATVFGVMVGVEFAVAVPAGDRGPGLGSAGEAGGKFGYPVGPVLLTHPAGAL